jgi:hypothetical protein
VLAAVMMNGVPSGGAVAEDWHAGESQPAEETPADEPSPVEGAAGEIALTCSDRMTFRARCSAFRAFAAATSYRGNGTFSIAIWSHDELASRNGLGGPLRC